MCRNVAAVAWPKEGAPVSPTEVMQLAEDYGVEQIDLVWSDLEGRVRHRTCSVALLNAGLFEQGTAISTAAAGSAAAFRAHHLRGVAHTAWLDPFFQLPTLSILAEVIDCDSGEVDPFEPRGILSRALAQCAGAAPESELIGAATLQCFVFEQAAFRTSSGHSEVKLESLEGAWRRGSHDFDNLGLQIDPGSGYATAPPQDALVNVRSEIASVLADAGVTIVDHGHGPAGAGQMEFRFAPTSFADLADRLLLAKLVMRNVAARYGKVATFMPKPLANEPGSGLSLGVDLQKADTSSLVTSEHELTDAGQRVAAGLSEWLPSLCGLTNPTVNSYHRLRELIAGGSGCLRCAPADPAAKFLLETPDLSGSPYLTLAAIAIAVHGGLINARPAQESSWAMTLDESRRTLAASRSALEANGIVAPHALDHLLAQFDRDLARTARPHPAEFELYFDR